MLSEKIIRVGKYKFDMLLGCEVPRNDFKNMVPIGGIKEVEMNGHIVTVDRRESVSMVLFIEIDDKIYYTV